MKIEDMDNKKNSTNENTKVQQKRRVIILILLMFIVLLVSLTCKIFSYDDDDDDVDDDVPTLRLDERIATGVKSTELAMKKTVDFYLPTEERGTFFAPTQTAFWSTQGPELTQNAKSLNQTRDAIEATDRALSKAFNATGDVKIENYYHERLTQTVRAIPKPPVIILIDYPSLIPKTGESIRGVLYFSDPNGDVVSQNYEVISAEPGFTGGLRDITKRLVSGTWYHGAIWIGFRCTQNWNVTVRTTLIDKKGNVSEPKNVSFSCR